MDAKASRETLARSDPLDRAASSEGPDAIVASWLEGLPDPTGLATRPEGLLSAYRDLGLALLGESLQGRDPRDSLDRPLARVTAVTRRSRMGIARTLDDLTRLLPPALAWLSRENRAAGAREESHVLEPGESVALALGTTMQRLARLMEASDQRARHERSEELAAAAEMLTHELRNRLGAARTTTELLQGGVNLDADQLRRAVAIIEQSLDAALRTVDDVGALAARREDEQETGVRLVRLDVLVRAVVEQLRGVAASVDVDLITSDDLVDRPVDAPRLRLVLFNLIGNGIKYRDRRKTHRWVRVGTTLEDDRIEVQVVDNGVGIPPDQLEDVFLYRVRGSGTEDIQGSGLGLAIVQEAVEQLGGRISVASDAREGTRFAVSFEATDRAAEPR